MRRLRTSHALVLFCIGVVVWAALAPLASTGFTAALTALWLIVPFIAVVLVRRRASCCDEQPVALLSILLSRAPPAIDVLA